MLPTENFQQQLGGQRKGQREVKLLLIKTKISLHNKILFQSRPLNSYEFFCIFFVIVWMESAIEWLLLAVIEIQTVAAYQLYNFAIEKRQVLRERGR